MLALVRLVVLALVASFGTASGALAHPAKPALRALGSSAPIASASSASNAAECVGKLGLHVRLARQDQRLGQYEDAETGLYYNRFRYYDAEAGQYASQDPIGLAGGSALYAYVVDPLTWVDVAGLNGAPILPERVLLEDGNTRIIHNYGDLAREHAEPIHFHVEENGKQIAKIKADGKVIDGKLNKNAVNMVERAGTKTKLRRAEKKIAGHIRASGGTAGGKPFKPGVRGGGCGKR